MPICARKKLRPWGKAEGHRLRFKTIDLMGSAEDFERQLLALGHGWAENITDSIVSPYV